MNGVLKERIEALWEQKGELSHNLDLLGQVEIVVDELLHLLESGVVRSCEKNEDKWIVNNWVKKGILLLFCVRKSCRVSAQVMTYRDKIRALHNFSDECRVIPTAYIREGVFVGSNAVIMPSFVNIGAYVGDNTMIDSYATVGSCVQIGDKCHISSSAVIGGVLEPVQECPVIIEDNCFVGAGSQVTEGVILGEGSVIGAGVTLTNSIKIYDSVDQKFLSGYVPPFSVVVSGVVQSNTRADVMVKSSIIIKKLTVQEREVLSINEILRSN
ncbi:2,3,4,5-tetrahydropyridine-2,6-dicarboxylate N-succinyltransferase [Candidatus Sneabacter namystus]|uniref:2,3,4,5-tetrahydropyridine-2,6-dicarboxylate N-succinyltransferase n=1 Tax=Candidatus Sneabacter namystus TaxID=2601646 RepID=A0A5C0UHE0_9RICK|nr:2,3,4,5-tetrahydropyridine-2,6-dicarboxylate N-succinyltransferase [Candidatus Sneabacter namystus]QEK39528.1 2,3,4,5-tetrahydropyridine-2,6-dicarboxylate N-succinyltransferase [Candidatus Sneabacter namystus]